MKLGKLGSKKLQKRGSESSNQVTDQLVHEALIDIKGELKAIRIILTYMSELDLDVETDIGEVYDNQ